MMFISTRNETVNIFYHYKDEKGYSDSNLELKKK